MWDLRHPGTPEIPERKRTFMSEEAISRKEAFGRLKPCDADQPYIFVSYSSLDWERVCRDVYELQRRGYNVWIDEKNLDKTKDSWKADALGAIRSYCCRLVIFYVSDSSLTSPQCLAEMRETCAQETVDIHFGEVKFICIDVKQAGDIREEARRIAREIEAAAHLSPRQKAEKTKALSVFLREIFNSNNERVRIHPEDEPDRKSDYYGEIMMSLPEQTRVFEEEAPEEPKKPIPAPGTDKTREQPEKPSPAAKKESPKAPPVIPSKKPIERKSPSFRKLGTLVGHKDTVNSATFSPDGTRIVTASMDNTARIWDAQTFREIGRLEGHTNSINTAAFSPDGRRIATASWDGTDRIWDAQTFREIGRLEEHVISVYSAAFSPDGRQIVTASTSFAARIWDAQAFLEIGRLEGHTDYVKSAAFSPDGRRIVTAVMDKTARIWDAQTFREIGRLEGHTNWVNSALFSPDGKRIVTASEDKTARIWDAQTCRELGQVRGFSYACYNPDGSMILTDGLELWDAESFREVGRPEGDGFSALSAAFSPDGRQIAAGYENGTVTVWEITY